MAKMTIKESWEAMLNVAPVHLTEREIEHARRCFYCGAYAMYEMTGRLSQYSDEEWNEIWDRWGEELKTDGPLAEVIANREAAKLLNSLMEGNGDANG